MGRSAARVRRPSRNPPLCRCTVIATLDCPPPLRLMLITLFEIITTTATISLPMFRRHQTGMRRRRVVILLFPCLYLYPRRDARVRTRYGTKTRLARSRCSAAAPPIMLQPRWPWPTLIPLRTLLPRTSLLVRSRLRQAQAQARARSPYLRQQRQPHTPLPSTRVPSSSTSSRNCTPHAQTSPTHGTSSQPSSPPPLSLQPNSPRRSPLHGTPSGAKMPSAPRRAPA